MEQNHRMVWTHRQSTVKHNHFQSGQTIFYIIVKLFLKTPTTILLSTLKTVSQRLRDSIEI